MKSTFFKLACALILVGNLAFGANDLKRKAVPWDEIRRQAEAFVQRESPEGVWPFERKPWSELRKMPNKVYAHFFVPFPLSFSNEPPAEDIYADYLDPARSDQVMATQSFYHKGSGGYIRQRPLPVGPWDTPHWQELNYAIQILRAQQTGIDGFSVDILQLKPGDIQYDRVVTLLETAANVAPGFPILLMPDAAAGFKGATSENAARALSPLVKSPAAERLDDGRVLIAPFYANARPASFWRDVLDRLEKEGISTAFFPVFLFFEKLEQNVGDFGAFSYGMSDWGFRDRGFAEALKLKTGPKIAAAHTPIWMMPVAPQDFRPKDLVVYEAENTGLFRYLWEAALETDSRYVQLITWDDYSEATEIAPSTGTQFLFFDLAAYYTNWFKTGRPPEIRKDAIYYCHREHLLPVKGLNPEKQRDHFQMGGRTPLRNDVEMIALLTAPADLEIEQNGRVQMKQNVGPGLQSFSVPAETGSPIFRILREGRVVAETHSNRPITETAEVENPLYLGGSSNRDLQ